jgi:hypothetical protein
VNIFSGIGAMSGLALQLSFLLSSESISGASNTVTIVDPANDTSSLINHGGAGDVALLANYMAPMFPSPQSLVGTPSAEPQRRQRWSRLPANTGIPFIALSGASGKYGSSEGCSLHVCEVGGRHRVVGLDRK